MAEQRTDAEVIAFPDRRSDTPSGEPEPGLAELLGEVLRDERHGQGRTLADVAEAAAVSLPYLSEVERGRKEASSAVVGAVVDALGLDLAEVLDRAADRLRSRPQAGGRAELRAA